MLNFIHSHANIQHCFLTLKINYLPTMLFGSVWWEPYSAIAWLYYHLNTTYNFFLMFCIVFIFLSTLLSLYQLSFSGYMLGTSSQLIHVSTVSYRKCIKKIKNKYYATTHICSWDSLACYMHVYDLCIAIQVYNVCISQNLNMIYRGDHLAIYFSLYNSTISFLSTKLHIDNGSTVNFMPLQKSWISLWKHKM